MPTLNNDGEGYITGTTVAMRAFYEDPDSGAAVSASSVVCVITPPSAVDVTYTYSGSDTANAVKVLDQPDTGQWEYRFYYTTTETGRHTYRITASGTGVTIKDGYFVTTA